MSVLLQSHARSAILFAYRTSSSTLFSGLLSKGVMGLAAGRMGTAKECKRVGSRLSIDMRWARQTQAPRHAASPAVACREGTPVTAHPAPPVYPAIVLWALRDAPSGAATHTIFGRFDRRLHRFRMRFLRSLDTRHPSAYRAPCDWDCVKQTGQPGLPERPADRTCWSGDR